MSGDAPLIVTAQLPEGLQGWATGLRNAAGFAIHPETGDLYLQDNGIDGFSDSNEPHSADELNIIPAAQIGGKIEDFGFPFNHVRYRTGRVVGGGIQPWVAFQPLPDPKTGNEAEGPNDICFAPPEFPEGLNHGLFVGFHGRFNYAGSGKIPWSMLTWKRENTFTSSAWMNRAWAIWTGYWRRAIRCLWPTSPPGAT